MPFVPGSFLFLVRPGAPSSVAPSSDSLVLSPISLDRLDTWKTKHRGKEAFMRYVRGPLREELLIQGATHVPFGCLGRSKR